MHRPLSSDARFALSAATEAAARRHQRAVEPRHLLLGLLTAETGDVVDALAGLGTSRAHLADAVGHSLPRLHSSRPPVAPQDLSVNRRAERILDAAHSLAGDEGRSKPTALDLLLALTSERGITRTILEEHGVEETRLRTLLRGEEPPPPREETTAEPEAPEPEPTPLRHTRAPDAWSRPETRADDVEDREPPAPAPAPETAPETDAPAELGFLDPDPARDEPLYAQIVRGVEEAVATGRVTPGRRLPSVRELADLLSVAPGTAAKAYRELEGRGVVRTRGRRGTYVAGRDPDAPPRSPPGRELVDRLRTIAVEAYHRGADADEVRRALERAMAGILTPEQEEREGGP